MKNNGIIKNLKDHSKNDHDLIFTPIFIILSIIFILIPPFNQTFLKIFFALPLLLFLPGYMFIAVMFPKRGELGAIERFTLSIGLSIAITVFDGFALNYTRWGFRPNSITISLSIIIMVLLLLISIQRWRYKEESFSFSYSDITSFLNSLRNRDPETGADHDQDLEKMLMKTMIIAILIVSIMLIYAKFTSEPEKFTSLYILGENGTADNYTTEINIGEPSSILVGIENYEYALVNYKLRVIFGGKTLREDSINLDHGSKWLNNITFTPELTPSIAFAGTNKSKLELQLFKDNKSYRSVHLLVNTSLDKLIFSDMPDLINGNMESNDGWLFSGSSPDITGDYINETMSSRIYEVKYTEENPGVFGIIYQNLTTQGNALATLSFDIKDSEYSNTSSIAYKQVLLDGDVIWEKRIGDNNNSWEYIEKPVLLSGNNTLAFRVYSRSRNNFSRTIWWDNIRLKPYNIRSSQLGEIITKDGLTVRLSGLSSSEDSSSMKVSIQNIGKKDRVFDLKPPPSLIDDVGNQYRIVKWEWLDKINQAYLNAGVLRKGTIFFRPINNSAKYLTLILYIDGEKHEFRFHIESEISDNDVISPSRTNATMGDTITQEGFAVMLRGFQNSQDWTSQVFVSVKNIENEQKPFDLNPSPVLIDDLGNQYRMINVQRSSQIKQTTIYPGAIRRGTIFFEPIRPDAKYLRLILYLYGNKYEFGFKSESRILEEKDLIDNISIKTNAFMGDTITQDGFAVMLKGFRNSQDWTSQIIIDVENMENEEKPFNLIPSPILIDDLGNQYEMVKIVRSTQIKQTTIYPGTVREGSIFFEPINPYAKFLRLILYLNEKKYEFGLESDSKIIKEKGLIGNISISTNASMGETITQGGFEIKLQSFQNTPDWTSQVIISVKNIENEDKQFKFNSTPVLIDDLGNQYDMINIKRSNQIVQTAIAPLARIEGSIFFEPIKPEAKYVTFILPIYSEKYIFGFEPWYNIT